MTLVFSFKWLYSGGDSTQNSEQEVHSMINSGLFGFNTYNNVSSTGMKKYLHR